jgi:hypothetical protein
VNERKKVIDGYVRRLFIDSDWNKKTKDCLCTTNNLKRK